MIKTTLYSTFLSAFVLFGIFGIFSVFAQEESGGDFEVGIQNIQIKDISINGFSGSFEIVNFGNRVAPRLQYVLTFLDTPGEGVFPVIYDEWAGEVINALAPQERREITFSYNATIPEVRGNTLMISLLGQDFSVVHSSLHPIFFTGSGVPLLQIDPSSAVFFRGEQEFERHMGVSIPSGAGSNFLSMVLTISNPSDTFMEAVIKRETYRRNFPQIEFSSVLSETYTLEPGETKKVTVFVQEEEVKDPGSYLVHFAFMDPQDLEKRVSNLIDARYVIAGVSATIFDGYFDRQKYERWETGTFLVQYVGPADFSTASGVMRVELFNHYNNVVLEEERNIELLPSTQTEQFEFVSQRGNENPWAKVTIKNNENVLAEYTVGEAREPFQIPWPLVLVATVLLSGVTLLFVFARKKHVFTK